MTATEGARVPIWRKTRAQKVDQKVESLFESYRMIDLALLNGKVEKSGQPTDGQ